MGIFSSISQYLSKCPPKISEEKREARVRNRRVHMANERTFLAWIRTSIGIMAFGFVVEKFALFIKQFSFFMSREPGQLVTTNQAPTPGLSSVLGIFLIGLGALMGVLAFVRYRKVECQIDADTYQPSLLLDILLTLSLFAIGIFLIIYLVHSL
jgi:putative membrane protein